MTDDHKFKQNHKNAGTSVQQYLAFALKNSAPNEPFARRLKVIAGFLKNTDAIAKDLFETRCQQGMEIATSMF